MTAPVASSGDIEQLIFLDRVQALYRPRIESVASGLVVGAVLAVALLRVHAWTTVLAWYLGICLVQTGRGTLLKLAHFRPVQIKDPVRWSRRYLIDVATAGSYWGVSLALLVRPEDVLTQCFIAMAIGGIAVGSMTIHAYYPPVMYLFLACLLLPFVARVMALGDFAHFYLGTGLLLLGAYLSLYGRVHARTLARSIALRHENRKLIAQLHTEHETALSLKATAEAASASKSRFFAGASHDLRQPLQALSLYASVLSDSHLPADLHQISLRVGESVRALEELFEGVLDITHIEAGGRQIVRSPVMVRQVLDRALLVFGGEALDKGLSIRSARCSLWVEGDPLALQRIVSNLAANAVRHTRSGRVLLGARRRGDRVRIAVLDTGPGIDIDARDRIFEEFHRLPTAGGRGFGLGLATVKRLCDAAGYTLGFDSVPGRGSTFWVELPHMAVATAPDDKGRDQPAPIPHAPLTILLVEDDDAARGGLEAILRSWGHACAATGSMREALEIISSSTSRWDAVISDFELPAGGNGLRLIESIRKASTPSLPAVLISGTMDEALRDAATLANCIPMSKPVRPMQLRSVIDKIAATQARPAPASAS